MHTLDIHSHFKQSLEEISPLSILARSENIKIKKNGRSHYTSLRRHSPPVRVEDEVPNRFVREIEPGSVG